LSSNPDPRPRHSTVIAAGLLLFVLAIVVIYTKRGQFMSPLALVVVAAIGIAALLLQFRLRPDLHPPLARSSAVRGSFFVNVLGVISALAAVLADFFHFKPAFMPVAALAAVFCFAVGGILLLSVLRKT
jgi:hypothetical protein